MTGQPNPKWQRRAMACPIRPMPIIPQTSCPPTCRPSNWVGVPARPAPGAHQPLALARAPRGHQISVSAISAVASVTAPGVLVTATPAARAASTSIWLKPDPEIGQQAAARVAGGGEGGRVEGIAQRRDHHVMAGQRGSRISAWSIGCVAPRRSTSKARGGRHHAFRQRREMNTSSPPFNAASRPGAPADPDRSARPRRFHRAIQHRISDRIGPDLARRKVHHRHHLLADQGLGA